MSDSIMRATGLFSWLRRTVSFAVVALALAGVAYWGHCNNWNFSQPQRATEPVPTSDGIARVRVGGELSKRSGAPAGLRREVIIEFDSADAVDGAGIAIAPAWPGPITEAVEASGEVRFDPALIAHIGPRSAGVVWRVLKRAGDPVAAGEVLALVETPGAGQAKADFQFALAQVRLREKKSANLRAAAKAVSAQTVREAEAELAEAETRLLAAAQALANLDLNVHAADYRELSLEVVAERMRLLGIPSNIPDLDSKTVTANLTPVRAPFAGVVLSADAVAGETAEPNRPLFVVTDPRRVWGILHVRADDASRVTVGQSVRFRTDGSTEEFAGRVEWLGRKADDATRTVPVRANLPNGVGRLRAGTLGRGRIVLRRETKAMLVPNDAVQMFRGAYVVFVRDPNYLKPDGPKAFHARPVHVGTKDAENTEIFAGLATGETVATKGSGLLLHELTRAVDTNNP